MSGTADVSKYQLLEISNGNKTIDIKGKVTSLDYYESLLSPNVTAVMTMVDNGDSSQYDKEYDAQERLGTIYNSLPITGNGQETVRFKVSSSLGTLDFTNKPFYINSAVNPDQGSNRESIVMSLVSKSAIDNQLTKVNKKYTNTITNSVDLITKNVLGLKDVEIDQTKNSYPFIGNNKSPFDTLIMLASKSIPEKGNPGFFFYETREKHHFKSIDNLIAKTPVNRGNPYYKTEINKSSINSDNTFKILSFSINKNQNLINALKSGVYSNRTVVFNPKTFKEEEISFVLNDDKLQESLGKKKVLKPENGSYTRTLYSIKDVGALSPTIKDTSGGKPQEWQGMVQMRYNLLFTQVANITVACNPNLKAGDVIECNFEIISRSEKEQGVADPVQSGKYLILDLCHHYDTERSFTSMTLVRDTYGKYAKEN